MPTEQVTAISGSHVLRALVGAVAMLGLGLSSHTLQAGASTGPQTAPTSTVAPVVRFPVNVKGGVLTNDTGDSFDVTNMGESIKVKAIPTNRDANSRMVLWRSDAKPSVDGETCIDFNPDSAVPTQEGVALRIVKVGTETKAITVTKNVYANITTAYNVHTWVGSKFTQLAGFDMAKALAGTGGINLCARVEGDQLAFKVWRSSTPEPLWDDPTKSRSVKLPAAWVVNGIYGTYAGHLAANRSLAMTPFASGGKVPTTPVVK